MPGVSSILTAAEIDAFSFPFLAPKPKPTSDYPTECPMCLGSLSESLSMGCPGHNDHVLCHECADMMVALAFTRAGEPTVTADGAEGSDKPLRVSKGKLEIECASCLKYDEVRKAMAAYAAEHASDDPELKNFKPKLTAHALPNKGEIAMPTFRSVFNSLEPNENVRRIAREADEAAKKVECDGPGMTPCTRTPTKRCPSCREAHFCDECDEAMHANAKRADHVRLAIEDAASASLLKVPGCDRHSGHATQNKDWLDVTMWVSGDDKATEEGSLYCPSCKTIADTKPEFKDHKWELYPNVIRAYQAELKTSLATIEGRHTEVQAAADHVAAVHRTLDANWEESQRRLANARAALLAAVNATMDGLTEEARRTYQLRAATLKRQHELLSKVSANLRRVSTSPDSRLVEASVKEEHYRSFIAAGHHTAYAFLQTATYHPADLVPAAIPELHIDVRGFAGVLEGVKEKAAQLVTTAADASKEAAGDLATVAGAAAAPAASAGGAAAAAQ